MGVGAALMAAALVWWLVVVLVTDDLVARPPVSARGWGAHVLYALGWVPMFLGISAAQDRGGWSAVGLAVVVALAVAGVACVVALVVVRALRRRRARALR